MRSGNGDDTLRIDEDELVDSAAPELPLSGAGVAVLWRRRLGVAGRFSTRRPPLVLGYTALRWKPACVALA